ncbi:MAG: THUMP domain-containing protein [Xenococcaceae cyanobacterium MO_188.B19]|nr:THUMP domain-containing protein [Xenococcaceae cyanobacterium MO_188.B19]
MFNWNVVVNLHEHGFRKAFKLLQGLGAVYTTDFLNVLVMKVSNIPHFLETLNDWVSSDSSLLKLISRIVPVTATFSFQSPEEFETKAQETVLDFLPLLEGKSFHIRMHRRGFKGQIRSLDEERFLDKILLEELVKLGEPGQITFEDPDAIIVVETVGQQAGLSCWNREDLQRYPLLRLD